MFRALRSAVGVPAGLLIVFLTLGTALPAALHGDVSDDACEVAGGTGAAGTHLQAGGHAPGSPHCGVCHWLRSLRVFQAHAAAPQPCLACAASVFRSAPCGSARLFVEPVPARAPPA